MAKVLVTNRNLEFPRMCTSSDGEHVQINQGAKNVPVDDKFLWKMHPDVILARDSVRTFKTAEEEAADQKNTTASPAPIKKDDNSPANKAD